jgi:hypothetical protein
MHYFRYWLVGIALASLLSTTARGQTLSVSTCADIGMSMLDPESSSVPPASQTLRIETRSCHGIKSMKISRLPWNEHLFLELGAHRS